MYLQYEPASYLFNRKCLIHFTIQTRASYMKNIYPQKNVYMQIVYFNINLN